MNDDDAAQPAVIFGQYIKALREEHGLSLRQAAEKAGIDHAALARLEKSNRTPTAHPETFKGLAHAYDVPLAELLQRVGYDIAPPDVRVCIREHYRKLPDAAVNKACAYIERLAAEYGADQDQPTPHHDTSG